MLTLVRIHNPFDRRGRDISQIDTAGRSLADLLAGEAPAGSGVVLVAVLNGACVPADRLAATFPRSGDQLLLMPVPTGGGGGMKNVLRIASWIMPVWAIGSMFAMGMGPQAQLAFFLNQTPGTSNPVTPSTGYQSFDQSNVYSWNPLTTQQQGIPIARHYGTVKLYGNVIGSFLQNGTDSRQYLNALICLGIGPLGSLTDFTINGNDYANLQGTQVYARLGHLDQDAVPNFNDSKLEYPQGIKVVNGAPVTISTNGSAFEGLEVDVTFPQGLWYQNDQGGLSNHSVGFSIEYKKQGDVSWTHMARTPYEFVASGTGYWSLGHWAYYSPSLLNPAGGWYWVQDAIGSTVFTDHVEGAIQGGSVWRWIWTSTTIGTAFYDQVTITGAQTRAIRLTYRADNLPAGVYDIRVTNLTADQTSARYGDDLYVTAYREVVYDDLTYPRLALAGVNALATDQISGGFSFSCMTTGLMVRIWDGAAWSVASSSNPAWVCWDILSQPIYDNSLNVLEYRGIDPARLDLTMFKAWADFCDVQVDDGAGGTEPRFAFNGSFDSGTNMWDAAMQVCRLGRAALVWNGINLTLFVDTVATPAQLFSVANIARDSFEETFLPVSDRAGEIEADFVNAAGDWQRDKITIIDPDNTSSGGKVNLPLFGCTSAGQAWRAGMYHLNCNRLLLRTCSFTVDVDALAATVGDVIHLQHDVPAWNYGGRVVSATVGEVVLDKTITLAPATAYSIMLRMDDDTIVERVISTAAGAVDTVQVTVDFDSAPDLYAPWVIGPSTTLTKEMRIIAIDPAGDLMRKLTCVEYNASVYGSDSGLPAVPGSNISALVFETITGVELTDYITKNAGGGITTVLAVTWDRPTQSNTKDVEVRYGTMLSNSTSIIVPASVTGVEIPGVVDGQIYRVWVGSVDWLGKKQLLYQFVRPVWRTIIGKNAPPSDVTNFHVTPNIGGGYRLAWTPVADIDVLEYLIRYSPLTANASWYGASELLRTAASYANLPIGQTGTYLIKAIDTTAHESDTWDEAVISVAAPSNIGLTDYALIEEHTAWTGTKSGCSKVGDTLQVDGTPADGYVLATYDCAADIDFGELKAARVRVQVEWDTQSMGDDFDAVDDIDGIYGWDGQTGLSDVQLWISTSPDSGDPANPQPVFAGDYSFQRASFQLRMKEKTPDLLTVNALTITVDTHDTVIVI